MNDLPGIHDINKWLEKMKATVVHHGDSCTVIIPRNDVFTADNQKAAALMAMKEYGAIPPLDPGPQNPIP